MSRSGKTPLILATLLGVTNGIWLFVPQLREQSEDRRRVREKAQALLESPEEERHEEAVTALRDAEASASRSKATEITLKPAAASKSWWSALGFSSGATTNTTAEAESKPPFSGQETSDVKST